jgi:hypothetical protein
MPCSVAAQYIPRNRQRVLLRDVRLQGRLHKDSQRVPKAAMIGLTQRTSNRVLRARDGSVALPSSQTGGTSCEPSRRLPDADLDAVVKKYTNSTPVGKGRTGKTGGVT